MEKMNKVEPHEGSSDTTSTIHDYLTLLKHLFLLLLLLPFNPHLKYHGQCLCANLLPRTLLSLQPIKNF